MHAPYRVARPRGTRSRAVVVGLSAALLASTFVATAAHGSGFLNARYGGDYGQPAIGSPYSVHFNPAAIGETTGTNIVLDGMFGYRAAKYVRPASALSPSAGKSATEPVYAAANTGSAKSSSIQGAPYLGITTDFGGKLPIFAGFASYVPEGGFSSYSKKSVWQNDPRAPGAYDGPQRWALVSGSQISWWNTLAVGGTIRSIRLSFGVSASIVHDTLTSLIARNKDSSDDLSTTTGIPTEGRSLLDVSGTHLAIGAGLFWRPMEDGKLRIGVSYLSRQGLSTARLKGSLRTQFGANPELTQDADVLMSFPDIIRFGAAFRATKQLDLRLDGEWVRWSLLKRQCVVVSGANCNIRADGGENVPAGSGSQILLNLDRQWRDAFGVRAGAGYFLTDDTELMGSFGIDTSAVPAAHLDATYFDAFKMIFSVGFRQRFAERWIVGASLTEMYYLPVDNTGSAINNTLQIPSRSPSNAGKYTSSITFFDVNVGVRF
jgi:long-chain fatty acid transport protein